ncbi:MAG: tetratricopeptide repeat protein [Nostoc sp.]|uniref:nSTAND1 domain-containing NTPase n=1 Tax=Nostoc sp. TaxID=1180 RepID=UPI002FF6C6B1
MSIQGQPENEPTDNERSLQQLAWTLLASVGKFKLIWARCNYSDLRTSLIERLNEISQIKIQVVQLEESERTLYSAIREKLQPDTQALMIVGWESLHDLPQMLTSANQVREEFRKNLSVPVVVWISEEIHHTIMEIAPDLESWGTSRSFAIAPDDLTQFIKQLADKYFSDNLSLSIDDARILESELVAAQRELQTDDLEIQANLASLLGLIKQFNNQLDAALEFYQQARTVWKHLNNLVTQNKILSEIAFCYYLKALKKSDINHLDWQATRQSAQEYVDFLNEAQRANFVASSFVKFGNILRDLKEWDKLQSLAQQALEIHQAVNQPIELAKDYSFLAQVALARGHWGEAKQFAQQALTVLSAIPNRELINISGVVSQLPQESVIVHDSSLYKYILAQGEYQLGEISSAIANLEAARDGVSPLLDLRLHLNILSYLQRLYFEQKEYLKAYNIKQHQQSVEQQFGLRAFIGAGRLQSTKQAQVAINKAEIQENIAPEIAASGRLFDVERLIERLGRPDYKIIVIHGQSGVGKSSLVNAGLIPALKNKSVGIQDYLPVTMRVYTNWVEDLGKLINKALHHSGKARNEEPKEFEAATSEIQTSALIAQLRENEQHNLRTVLIFDQFEEFFFVYPLSKQRQQFFEFLGECLNILSVKVILSLRVDYLHYLLECNELSNMTIIGKDILSSNVLYKLGNFSLTDAKSIIERLTETTSFHLEPALIEQLVQDLAIELGEVRPIELQVAGAQLQTENITTLAEYQQRGTKEELVKRYLAEVVNDCGVENQQIAELLLYLLTDEKGTRPLKTCAELSRELQALVPDITSNSNRLDLVLEILVKSGLVVLLPENPADRYQLVHDYIALFIHQQQEPKLNELIEELEKERKQRLLEQEQRLLTEQQLKQSEETQQILGKANKTANQRILVGSIVLATTLFAAIGIGFLSFNNIKNASESSRVEREGNNTLKQFESDQLGALLRAMHAGQDLKALVKDSKNLANYPTTSPVLALTNILGNIHEHNKINSIGNNIFLESFTSDGQWATARKGDVGYLFKLDGQKIIEFKGHRGFINEVIRSSDGQRVLITGADNATLWNMDGRKLDQFDANATNELPDFSPSGKYLITIRRSEDIATIFNSDGQKLAQFKIFNSNLASSNIEFSPDENLLIIPQIDSSLNKKAIRLYNRNGEKLAELKLPLGRRITTASFSPDSQKLLVAGDDGIVRLWKLNSQKLIEFRASRSAVYYKRKKISTGSRSWIMPQKVEGGLSQAQFSSDGERLVTVDNDQTIKLWNLSGQKLAEFGKYGYNGVKEVRFVQNGKNLVTVDDTGEVNLWSLDGKLINSFQGAIQYANEVSFTSDEKLILIKDGDQTIRVWSLSGQKVFELKGSQQGYISDFHLTNKELIVKTDGGIRFFNFEQKTKKQIKGRSIVRFSPNSQQLITGHWNNETFDTLWSIQGKLLAQLKGYHNINAAAFSPDGMRIVIGGGSDIKLWDSKGKLLRKLDKYSIDVQDIQFSPNGQYFALRGERRDAGVANRVNRVDRIILLSLNNLDKKIFIDHKDSITDMHFSLNGQYFVTVGEDDIVKLFKLNGQKITEFKAHQNGINKVKFGINSKVLATAGNDGTAKLWDITGKLLVKFNGHQGAVNEVQFSPNEQYLVTAGSDGNTKLWNLTGKMLVEIKGYNSINRLRFSPDKQRLVTQDRYSTKVWTLNGKLLAEYQDHLGELEDVEFSPDGNYLATASSDDKIVLWPVEGFEQLLTRGCSFLDDYLVNHPKELVQLEVCQDKSRKIAAASFLIKEGEEQARQGNIKDAVEPFRQALKWNPNLTFNPETKAQQLAKASALIKEGEESGERGNVEVALAAFQKALKLDPSLDLKPKTKVASLLVTRGEKLLERKQFTQGDELGKQGNVEVALAAFQKALKLDPSLDFQPKTKAASLLVTTGEELLKGKQFKQAAAAYREAQNINPKAEISANAWNSLCWDGSLGGYAAEVMDACDKAVAIAPDDRNIQDSRGLARALTGDTKGAIKDFEAYIAKADGDSKAQRQSWVKDLRAGKNPFTDAVLEKLRSQQ